MGSEVVLKGHCVHRELTRVKLPLDTAEQKEPWTFTRPGMPGQPDPFCSEVTKRPVSLGPSEGRQLLEVSESPCPNGQIESTGGHSSCVLLESPRAEGLCMQEVGLIWLFYECLWHLLYKGHVPVRCKMVPSLCPPRNGETVNYIRHA